MVLTGVIIRLTKSRRNGEVILTVVPGKIADKGWSDEKIREVASKMTGARKPTLQIGFHSTFGVSGDERNTTTCLLNL